jgi:hypothetical protein
MVRKTRCIPLFILLLVLIIPSCAPDEFTKDYNTDILWTPTYNGPVAFGNFTLKDILDEMLDTAELETDIEIDEDSTNLYYVAYSDSLTALRADNWFKLANQYFPEVFFYRPVSDIPAAALGNIGDTIPTQKTKDYPFTMKHQERLDSIRIKTGMLYTDVYSTLHHTGYLVIHSDKVMVDDQYYRDTIIISDTTGTFENHTVKPLDGTVVYLDNQKSPDSTFLEFKFDLYIINSGNDINAGQQVLVNMSFTNLKFQSVYGYLGDHDTILADNDKIDFELFKYKFNGNVYFGDPRFNYYVKNSFGLPLGIDLYNLSGHDKDGQSTQIIFEPGANPFIAQGPDFSQIGESVLTKISINNGNSNVDDITSTKLSYFMYSMEALTNLEGPENRNHFILDTSKVNINYEVVLPMNLRAEDFELEDTVEFDLSDIPDENDDVEIKSFQVRMETTNGMPVEIDMQVVLVDTFYNVLDSLFTEETKNVLPSALVDANGKVLSPSHNEIPIDFSPDRLDLIRNTRHAMVRGTFETTDEGQTMVKFYSYYEINFKLGVKTEISTYQK